MEICIECADKFERKRQELSRIEFDFTEADFVKVRNEFASVELCRRCKKIEDIAIEKVAMECNAPLSC